MDDVRRFTVELPADVLPRLVAEARADGDTIGEWIAGATLNRLRLRLPIKQRRQVALRCRGCDQVKHLFARGYCKPCYRRLVERPVWPEGICRACKETRPLRYQRRHLCNRCYQRLQRCRKARKAVA
jgi:rRNA maturation endonuclease Nob1